jgi:hypothetical protein
MSFCCTPIEVPTESSHERQVCRKVCHPSRTNVVLLDGTGVVAPARDLARKNPILLRLRALLLPVEQNRGEVMVEREIVLRVYVAIAQRPERDLLLRPRLRLGMYSMSSGLHPGCLFGPDFVDRAQ